MSILKNSILFIFLLFAITVKAQTVIDFIRMIDTNYQPYQEGENKANDSLIDIKNGYYQRGFSFEGEQGLKEQKILRQLTVFANNDGTKTIVETISYYDFVCWTNEIKFYYYNGETLQFVDNNDHFLPPITEEDLLSEEALFIFKKLYKTANQNQYITLAGTIKNAYDIRYVLPRYGTKIMVHLDFCDHFDPDINLEISEEDYNIIENGIVPIKISYDKEYKQFVK